MQAMLLERIASLAENPEPLRCIDWPQPTPGPGEVLIQVAVCGVCHTELDEIEGRTPPPRLPMILGHQVVGRVVDRGPGVAQPALGERVGVAWIHSSCGLCDWCRRGEENLCPRFQATGRDAPGGYAEFMTAPAAFVYPIPAAFSDSAAAPLLCAGAIGYRSLRLAGLEDGQILALTGFGASAHLVLALVRHLYPRSPVWVFARSPKERAFALELGAAWAGDTSDQPPALAHAIIDTTPVWKPIVEGLKRLAPGGRLVINAIRKEDSDRDTLLQLDYPAMLWLEKEIKSVANVTRGDVQAFLTLAAEIPIRPQVEEYPLAEANRALRDLKAGHLRGAKVLRIT
ncbi:zinc-dependent alcohol dehydrogenase family protein [Candidatus Methylocalor cossyra]|uniref:alcohol dehydrogenase n=1 Tax=Candidatus Methylocalor cossyra TaxID=3108543 RepID=A0ABM9NGJ2_9GAMM